MMSRGVSLVLCGVLALCLTVAVRAQGTSGSQFLGIGMGARSIGMGGAYVSVADDGSSLYWNAAGLSRVSGRKLTVSHVSWFEDVGYQFAGYAAPLGVEGAIGLALERGSVGSWDNTGAGSIDAGDFYGALGYGRRIRPNLGLGASVKYLRSTLGDASAASYAFDLGVVYRVTGSLSLGGAARNIGPGLTFEDETDPLPAALAFGGSYARGEYLFALDLEKQNDLSMVTRAGMEYTPLAPLCLRGGIVLGEDSALSPVMGGIGVNWNETWGLDYSYRPGDLGGAHWFSLSTGLGGALVGAGDIAASASRDTGAADEIEEVRIPQSNLTLLTQQTRQAAAEVIEKMALPAGCEIYTRQGEQHDANWLVHSILLEELTARGHVVMTGPMPSEVEEEPGRPRREITYRIVSFGTSYPRVWRQWLVGSKKVERRSDVDLHFRLSDSTGAVIWAGEGRKQRRDIVPGGRVSELATPGIPFASPELESAGWDRVLEPIVVTGIVGGLIYLFYTSKSTD